MTDAPRLIVEMRDRAARLHTRASGYRMTGEKRLARANSRAAEALLQACVDLTALASMEGQIDGQA